MRTMEERPCFRHCGLNDGFPGYIRLCDEENRRAKGVMLWESQEAAEAAEETLAERRQQMAGGIGLAVDSADLYEAPIVRRLEVSQRRTGPGMPSSTSGRTR